MKRSEAILSLSEKLQKSQNLLDGYKNGSIDLKCLCDNLATRAIDYCENELGMLPPSYQLKIKNTGIGGAVAAKRIDGNWEPEDEEK